MHEISDTSSLIFSLAHPRALLPWLEIDSQPLGLRGWVWLRYCFTYKLKVEMFISKLTDILKSCEECRGKYELVPISGDETDKIADVLVGIHNRKLNEEVELLWETLWNVILAIFFIVSRKCREACVQAACKEWSVFDEMYGFVRDWKRSSLSFF